MGHFWARCMLGFDLKPRSHHHSDGAWVVRGCYLSGGLLDPRQLRSLPNKAVDVIACKLSGDRLLSASSTYGSLARLPLVLSLSVYAAACCTIAVDEA